MILDTKMRSTATRAHVATISADLEQFVQDFANHAPQPGDAFQLPTADQRAHFVEAWSALRAGDAAKAAALAGPLDMEVARLTDTVDGVTSLAMFDRGQRAKSRGFGLYVVRPGASHSALNIQVPHPWDDEYTGRVGTIAYRAAKAGTLAVAGASRWTGSGMTSDVAHSAGTMFQAVSENVAEQGAHIVQIHGFVQSEHKGYGNAVVSMGAEPDTTDDFSKAIRAQLVQRKFDAKLVGQDGPFPDLAAHSNVQGSQARAAGASWVHVELGNSVRYDAAARARVAEGIAAAAISVIKPPRIGSAS